MKTCTIRRVHRVLPALAALLALPFTACTYDAPLENTHTIAIDPEVLGIWQSTDEEADGERPRMAVLAFSPTEYLIHYPTAADDSMYFRGYAIQVADIPCIQLELLGSHKGRETSKTRFQVATYTRTGDRLEIRMLNESVISSDLTGTEALRAAFRKHAADPKLFNDPGTFARISK